MPETAKKGVFRRARRLKMPLRRVPGVGSVGVPVGHRARDLGSPNRTWR
jgi:hypothetical protein